MKKRSIATLAVLLLIATLSPISTHALNKSTHWARSYNPLIAQGYNSKAWAYGDFRVARTSSGTKNDVKGKVRVKNADNHKGFLTVEFQANSGRCITGSSVNLGFMGSQAGGGATWTCDRQFHKDKTITTSRVSVGKGITGPYVNSNGSAAVNHNGTTSRAAVKACLDIPWRKDVCTGWNYSGIDTY